MSSRVGVLSSAVGIAFFSQSVFAQADGGVEAKNRNRMLEEVVVTAQKREESVRDIPISLQAFTPGILDAKGVVNIADLPTITPGLTITSQVGYTTAFIRGVGSDAFILGDPSVASYIDNVYFPLSAASIQNFGAVERIEVLKGPQGTLFGRNAVGGAINVITKKPSLQEMELSFQSVYEAEDSANDATSFRTRGHINLPLIEGVLAASIAVVRDRSENHVDGIINSGAASESGLPELEEDGLRVKLLWAPTDTLELLLTATTLENNGVGTSYAPNVSPTILGTAAGVEAQDKRAGRSNEAYQDYSSSTTDVYSATLTSNLDQFDVKLFAGDQKSDVSYMFDFDGSPVPVASFIIPKLLSYNKSAELQLISNDTSWGSDWLKWVFGSYYFDGEQGFDPAIFRVSLADPTALLGSANTLLGNLGLPPLAVSSSLVDLMDLSQAGDIEITGLMGTESLALYTQGTITVTDWMDITLGARYTEEERWLIESGSGVSDQNGDIILPIQSYKVSEDPSLRVKTYSFDPKVSFDFRPAVSWLGDDPLFYVSYQSATKSAIFNAVNIVPRTDALLEKPKPLKTEKIKAYEMGIKTAFFNGMTTFNAAIFSYEIDDPQVQFVSLFAGGAVQFENAGKQEQRGFEFDFLTPIFPSVIDSLVLSGGALFLEAEYAEFMNASGFDENGIFSNTNDYSGNDVVRSPDFSGNIGIVKTWGVGDGDLELGVDYAHMGSFYWAAKNTQKVQQDSYGLLGARVSYIYDPWGMRLTVFGRNLTDSDYNYSLFETDFGALAAAAAPMSYGLRINFDY